MSKTYITKIGTKMKTETRLKILDIMSNPIHNGKTQEAIAKIVGITSRTLRLYLTDEMWDDINKLRLDVISRQLERVDQAVYAKAIQGDMSAARLIYGRWKEINEALEEKAEEHTQILEQELKEADDEIKRLRNEITALEQQFPLGHQP